MSVRSALVPVLASLLCLVARSAFAAAVPADGEPCKGTLELGGKTYKLKYAVAYSAKVFDDVGTSVLFAEQAIPVEELKTALREGKGSDDKFFLFKPHVTVTFDKGGKVMFCNAYGDNTSASVSGSSLTGELTTKDGRATGKATLVADADSSHKSSFSVPAFDLAMVVVPVKPDAKPADGADKPSEKPGKKPRTSSKDTDVEAPAPADAIPYKKLPLPDDATAVEYKKLVGQIKCNSRTDYKTVAKALTKKLADQGWKTDGSDLVGPKSAILKRKRGEADLTIFVKPAESGSTVTVMSEGLSWEE